MAKAAIVSTSPVHAAARHRAAQLQIAVIDLEELQTDRVPQRLQVLMKTAGSMEEAVAPAAE